MNDVDYIKHRMKARKEKRLNDHHFNRFYNFMIRVMIAIVVGIAVFTYFKSEPDHTVLKKFIMEDLRIENIVGKISQYFSPFFSEDETIIPVSQEVDYQLIDKNYFKNNTNQVKVLSEGTIIYVGHQDILQDYVIIQGINGVKVTYGKIGDMQVKLYDYVHVGDILGTYDANVILIFEYDGKEISYEEAKSLF